MKLWLDDLRPPPDDTWHWAHNYDEAIAAFQDKDHGITHASLDHDLGDTAILQYVARDENGNLQYSYAWHLGDPCPSCGGDTPPKFNGGSPFFTCCNISVDEYQHVRSHKEKTGYDVTLWMAENERWPSEGIVIHSWNPGGAERMAGVVDRYGPYDKMCPRVPDTRDMYLPELLSSGRDN